ncbi:MAG: hypothetical protein J6Y94_06205, partial [Bacteriovoracaceae bacterium]|nr:hypothetical protein [Bacteriovoracaceae bacterium]
MIRKLLAVGLAFCLFNLQISFSGQSLTPSSSIPTKSWGSWVKVEFAKAEAATSTSTFKPQKIDTADYISLITMLVLAVAATSMVVTCKIGANIDVYLFAASALAYIMGEIAVNMSYKKINTNAIEYNENGDLTDKQYKSLVALRDSYKDVKGSAETKRTLQLAAGAGMLAASGIAAIDYAIGIVQHAECKTCLLAPVGETCKSLEDKSACEAAKKAAIAADLSIEAMKAVTQLSVTAVSEVNGAATGTTLAVNSGCAFCPYTLASIQKACTMKWAYDVKGGVSCVPFASNELPQWLMPGKPNLLALALNAFIPAAQADDLISMLGIGAVGLGIVAGLLIAKKTF